MISFYGGKQGFSINLVKTYSTKKDMDDNYKNDLSVGDYCLVSNVFDQANIHHGDLYMRDFEGVVYKGNISGPPGVSVNAQTFVTITEGTSVQDMITKLNGMTFGDDITAVVCGYNESASPKYYFLKITKSDDNSTSWVYAGSLGNQVVAATEEPDYLLPGDVWLQIEEA